MRRLCNPLILIMLVPTCANADIITGTFTGEVYWSHQESLQDDGSISRIDDGLVGTRLVGTLSFDTDQIPDPFELNQYNAIYYEALVFDWLEIGFEFETGEKFEVDQRITIGENSFDSLHIENDSPGSNNQLYERDLWGVRERFYERYTDNITNHYIYDFIDSTVFVMSDSSIVDFVNNLGVDQIFSIYDFSDYLNISNTSSFDRISDRTDLTLNQRLSYERTSFDYELTSFSLTRSLSPPTTVPEPSTFALFGIGLAAMGLARRRRQLA